MQLCEHIKQSRLCQGFSAPSEDSKRCGGDRPRQKEPSIHRRQTGRMSEVGGGRDRDQTSLSANIISHIHVHREMMSPAKSSGVGPPREAGS